MKIYAQKIPLTWLGFKQDIKMCFCIIFPDLYAMNSGTDG